MAHLFIVAVNDSFDRKNVNHFQIYYVLDFSFFMSQDDAYYHIHQNDPVVVLIHRSKAELYFFPIGQPGFLSNQAGSLFRPHTSSKVIAYIP